MGIACCEIGHHFTVCHCSFSATLQASVHETTHACTNKTNTRRPTPHPSTPLWMCAWRSMRMWPVETRFDLWCRQAHALIASQWARSTAHTCGRCVFVCNSYHLTRLTRFACRHGRKEAHRGSSVEIDRDYHLDRDFHLNVCHMCVIIIHRSATKCALHAWSQRSL